MVPVYIFLQPGVVVLAVYILFGPLKKMVISSELKSMPPANIVGTVFLIPFYSAFTPTKPTTTREQRVSLD